MISIDDPTSSISLFNSPVNSPANSPSPPHENSNMTIIKPVSSLMGKKESSNPESESAAQVNPSTDDMSAFQSANERYVRLNRTGGNGVNADHEGNSTGSWRKNTTSGGGMTNMSDPYAGAISTYSSTHQFHIHSVQPGPVWPSTHQLAAAHGYAIRLNDGRFTRVFRADELQEFNIGCPPSQDSCQGLIVLPSPELPQPHLNTDPRQFVNAEFIKSLPLNRDTRPSDVLTSAARGYENYSGNNVQHTIDNILANNPVSNMGPPAPSPATPRRQKTYCDKWIHEGICAFTQLGCKYKHEMPMDKATQISVGLNHGLPPWYKRANSIQLRPEGESPPHGVASGPWRRAEGGGSLRDSATSFSGGQFTSRSGAQNAGPSLSCMSTGSPAATTKYGQSNFGPISRPNPPNYQQPASYNSYSLLGQDGDDSKMMEDELEEGQVTPTKTY